MLSSSVHLYNADACKFFLANRIQFVFQLKTKNNVNGVRNST